jgi:ATP synthase protein I
LRVLADDRRTDGDELDRRIADAKAAQVRGVSASQARAEGRGWAVGIEFVGTVLVCGLIGWLLDKYVFNSAPWAMIVLLLLGFAAGTRRAMTTSKQFDAAPGNDSVR